MAPTKTKAAEQLDAERNLSLPADQQDVSAMEDVQAYRKVDFANPESPVLPVDESVATDGPRLPQPVKIGPGDTAAAHESHALVSSPANIAARIEAESGPNGLTADVIARRQHEEIVALESGRIDGDGAIAGVQSATAEPGVGPDIDDTKAALPQARPDDKSDAKQAEAPAKSASRADWDKYAESKGLDPAEYSSKDDLIAAASK